MAGVAGRRCRPRVVQNYVTDKDKAAFPIGTRVDVRFLQSPIPKHEKWWLGGTVVGYTPKRIRIKLDCYPYKCQAAPTNLRYAQLKERALPSSDEVTFHAESKSVPRVLPKH